MKTNLLYILFFAFVLTSCKSETKTSTSGPSTTYLDSSGKEDQYLGGIKMIPIRGLGENQIIMTTVSNLFVGTDLESDFAEIRTIDMRETTGDDTLRFKMRFKLDAQYGYADQVVLNTI